MQREPLKLGLFMPNNSYSMSISTYKKVPDDWTYAENLRIARAAEEVGFDFLFPASRWKGLGGKTNFLGTGLDTMTWATALLANTERIQVYSTIHVPVFEPFVVAKMGASMDHVGGGRWGINIVSGWNRHEFEMMGIDLLEHEARYQRSADFIRVLRGLWEEEPGTFNFASPWYTVCDGWVSPQPKRPPPIVNAGISEAAREVVAELCDWCFLCPPTLEETRAAVADIKKRGEERGRRVRCVAAIFALWEDTRDEAEREKALIIEHADTVALERWASGVGIESGSFDNYTRDHFLLGAGTIPIVGSREEVADAIAALYRVGIDGVLMGLQSYHDDTRRFANEIVPLLSQAGVV